VKVALAHDYLTQYGGAERVLEVFCKIFPKAPIYTLLYDTEKTGRAFVNCHIRTSYLQKLPLIKSHHRSFLLCMPFAIEQFDFSDYDLVFSDSASFAKGIITSPRTLHINYCHTPTRYAWDDSHRYIKEFNYPKLIKKTVPFFMNYIRFWDVQAADRVDKFIANSQLVAERIKKYYGRKAAVIYPSVKTNQFYLAKQPDDYFLLVGRLLPDKHFDYVIETFNHLGLSLKIIGDGPERQKLEKLAKGNIEFLGLVSEEKLKDAHAHCQAFIFPQEADFGIAGVEAMASGRPVIAYKIGGALEIIENGITGLFYKEPTVECLAEAVAKFRSMKFYPELIKQRSERFDEAVFEKKIRNFVKQALEEYSLEYRV